LRDGGELTEQGVTGEAAGKLLGGWGHCKEPARRKHSSSAVSLQRPLLSKCSIVPAGEEKMLKGPRLVFRVAKKLSVELRGSKSIARMVHHLQIPCSCK